MKVDVVIPCYNAERYLAQTISCALEQTLAPHQVIVVDDGSTDGSLAIARKFAAACNGQVRVHSERSGSAARSRNIGALFSDADAFMFLDADDVLAPDTLEALAGALAEQPNGFAGCPWRRLRLLDGKWLSQPATCAPRRPGQDGLAGWLTGWYYPTCSVLWSRTAFEQSGRWDDEAMINDDGDLVMRALAYGFPLTETSAGMSYYRILPDGETSLSGKKATYSGLEGRLAVIEKVSCILEEKGRLGQYRAAIARALEFVEQNAANNYDGLWQQARRRRQYYAPSVWNRLTRRFRTAQMTSGQTSPVRTAPEEPEEISYGLGRAEEILAGADSLDNGETLPWCTPARHPVVTVIVPVFNRAHLLEHTLQTVIGQSFTDFEVILVDDCSDDDPTVVVESLKDSRLRYVCQPENLGVAAARNRGLREAKGDFIAFLDDDDEWFPEKLALQVGLFRHSPPDVGLIYTGVETLSDDGTCTQQIPSARGDLYRELLVRNIFHGGGSNIMIRKNVVARVGFFDESLPAIEDYDYWLRITRWYRADFVSTPLIRYNDFRAPVEGRESQKRRSLNIQANLAARAHFFDKHGAEMRSAGLAHLFLVTSARRSLAPELYDVPGARRLALRALLLAPGSWGARDILISTFGPLNLFRELVNKSRHNSVNFQGGK